MQTRTIAFANQKGGVGKTTSAVNLAAALAERGKRVLLVDLDPQTNATSGVGLEPKPGGSLYSLLLGADTPATDMILPTAFRNLDAIPSEIDLAGAEVDMARREHYLHGLQNVLAPLQNSGRYAFIILDCPPSLGILTMNALTAAQGLIVPSQCEYLALEGLSVITRLVAQLRTNGANPNLRIEGILMTMFDSRTKLGAQVIDEVRRHFGDLVFETVIPRNVRLSEAPSFGRPVLSYDSSSVGAMAYRALSRELLRRLKAAEPRPHAPATPANAVLASVPDPHSTPAAPPIIIPKPLTRRERLRRCFFHEELDRPAVYCHAACPPNDPSYDRLKTLLAERTELKAAWNGLLYEGPADDVIREPHSEDFERRIVILHTPKGDLRSSTLISLKGLPDLVESPFIQSSHDAEKYLSLPEPEIGGPVEGFFEADRLIGDAGITDVSLGLNPAGTVAALCGSNHLAMLLRTDRDAIHALCEQRMKLMLRVVAYLLERKVGPFFSMTGEECLTPPLHGLKDFHDFNVRYDKPIADLIHNAGGRLHIHCRGRLKAVLPAFLEIGPDVLHPVEAPPMGDVTAAEAKAIFGSRTCLEGNLPIAGFYERTPEHIREETAALIAAFFGDRRNLIVSPTASPSIRNQGETCFPQYQAMIETVLDWKA